MITVEEEGRTPDEAVDMGLLKLGLSREYVLVETLDEGAKGFLGLGGRQARVRLTLTPAGEQLLLTRRTIEDLLRRIGVVVEVKARETRDQIHVDVSGEDAGLLIGKQGQTLEALAFLSARILNRQGGERVRIEIDVGGYRDRRRQMLEQRALRLAEQVKSTGESVTLEPMSSVDRRVIHLALQQDLGVHTASEGEGLRRRLVIAPADRRG